MRSRLVLHLVPEPDSDRGQDTEVRAYRIAPGRSGDAHRGDSDLQRADACKRPAGDPGAAAGPDLRERVADDRHRPTRRRPDAGQLHSQAAAPEGDRPRDRERCCDRLRRAVEIADHPRARRAVRHVRARPSQRLVLRDPCTHRQQVGLQTPTALTALVLLDQHAQLPARALRDLAVLLHRPAVAGAELAGPHIDIDLARKHQLLVTTQIGDDFPQSPQLDPGDHLMLDSRAAILQFAGPVVGRVNRHCSRDRRLDRAATADRPPAIFDPAQKFLLKRIEDVLIADERRSTRARDQLERGLAVAVLEVLPAQASPVDAKQPPAPSGSDPRNLLGRIPTHIATREPHRGLFRRFGINRDSANVGFHNCGRECMRLVVRSAE